MVHFPASVSPGTCSSLRIALLWQCLSFCDRTANMMFSHEEECAVPRCSVWKIQDCCVLFLIIRCQGFKTEQFWRVLLLQMLLVWDVKPSSAFLHPTWHELEEADNENAAFYWFFSPLAVIRAATGRRLLHTLGLLHTCHRVCEIRVSACMCKMHIAWIRQPTINMHMIKGCICVHVGAWNACTFSRASFICVHVYVCVPECSKEELWRVTSGLRKGHYYCL